MKIALNSHLETKAPARAFKANRRIQVRDLFEPDSAEFIHLTLVERTFWRWQYLENGQTRRMSGRELRDLPLQQRQDTWRQIYIEAQEGPQFLHYCYPMADEFAAGNDLDHDLVPVLKFLESETFLKMVRTVTGEKSISGIDALATWFQRDQFSNSGGSSQDGIGFELNFTRGWRPDFGGYLQFFDDEGNIEQGFCPRDNSLTLFDARQPHAVGYVTPFSENFRVAISGTFVSA